MAGRRTTITRVIADAHTDLLQELAWRERRLGEVDVFKSTWLPLLDRGGVRLQVCPVWVDASQQPEGSLRESLSQVTAFHHAVAENPDRVVWIRNGDDLEALDGTDAVGLVLSLEGVEQFGIESWPADLFHALGVRIAGLTWNRRNAFADGAAETSNGGLSRVGRELVERFLGLGVVLDLAHSSPQTFTDVLELTAGQPVLCSHGGCRAVHETPRNLTDDQLRALAEANGMFGLMLHPLAIDPVERTLERAADHLDHAVALIGADRVCLGGDFTRRLWEVIPLPAEPKDGLMPAGLRPGQGLEGLTGSEDYPNLVATLEQRGWTAEQVAAVTGGNLTRFLRDALS